MANPIIGVTTYQGKNDEDLPIFALIQAYVDALILVGCTPILIPSNLNNESLEKMYMILDGILFSGGGDIAINLFAGQPHPSINGVDQERDSFELSILHKIIKDGKPFLGICRGFQLINVGLGGQLYTHISDQMIGAIEHAYYPGYPRNYLAHKIKVKKGTQLAKIIEELEFPVNSFHHQGVRDVPPSLIPAAYAQDGLVEAVELIYHPFGMAVQWHPEWLTNQSTSRKLFQAFAEAADH